MRGHTFTINIRKVRSIDQIVLLVELEAPRHALVTHNPLCTLRILRFVKGLLLI